MIILPPPPSYPRPRPHMQARGTPCLLGPGDVMYIPAFWSLHCEAEVSE